MADSEETLDPDDWDDVRNLSHQIVDDAINYTRDVRHRPVWQEMPEEVRSSFKTALPQNPLALNEVYKLLAKNMMPYPMGNIHPRFWMWYMGTSNFTGALGDFLAAILGSNLGGGNHAAAMIDQQVVNWCKEMLGFPQSASGTLVSGGSMANLLGLTIARNQMAGIDVREHGVSAIEKPLRFYGSDQLHSCHQTALETLGLGHRALHYVGSGPDCTMDIGALKLAIAQDRAAGLKPACVIATAGTVNTGAVDDLQAIAEICKIEDMVFHVDGCIGALIAIAPQYKDIVSGIEKADSIALDPHKWLHAPFEVGCLLVRDRKTHRNTFAVSAEYLEETARGVASAEWLHDYGVQTSRGFRALKVWMALQEHGIQKFGRLIDQNINQAQYLTNLIAAQPNLEITTKTIINIVCFRFNPGEMTDDELKLINTEIMLQMQETGVAAVSDTTVHGQHCLRVAINNHRTTLMDLDILINETVRLGVQLAKM